MHAWVLCTITWSTFSKRLWGFEQDVEKREQWRVGRVVLGIFIGSLVGMIIVVGLVLFKGIDGGRDPSGWAWIDVVSELLSFTKV